MRGSCAVLVALLLAPALGFSAPAAFPPTPGPLALASADVPTWLVGDTWTYSSVVLTRNGTDWTDIRGNLTFTVRQRFEALHEGSFLHLYNASTAGDLYGRGNLTDPNFGTVRFTLASGTIAGYAWTDRGDLAAVRANQTIWANGTAQTPLGARPLTMHGETTVVNRPPEEDLDFPIAVGDAWRVATTVNTTGFVRVTVRPTPFPDVTIVQPLDGNTPTDMRAWANFTGPATVPAGTFDAFLVHSSAPGGVSADRWYAPNASNYVRLESHEVTGPTRYTHTWTNLTRYSLIAPARLTVTLVPDKVGPGAPFEVRGTSTSIAATVRIVVPWTNTTAVTTVDALGAYTVTVSAPVTDDDTPANTDIGSHGVLVEASSGLWQGFNASTVTLLRPDLTVSGLSAAPAPVDIGAPADLRVTVSAATNVSLYAPVDVTFVSEDVDLDGNGVLDSPIGVYCGRGSCIGTVTIGPILPPTPVAVNMTWMPNPPTLPADVRVSAVVDPLDDWNETDEANNLVVATVRVDGPNLTTSNVTAEVRGIRVGFDPAAIGSVSPLIDVPLAAVVNLTVRVRNAGAVNASRATTLALYNTTTLNGTGGIPFFQAPVAPLAAGTATPDLPAAWAAPSVAGVYYVNVTADRGDVLRETSEADNTFVLRLRVFNATSLPDLVPVSVNIPAQASVNRTVWIGTRVENRGGVDAAAFRVAFYNGTAPTPFAVVPTGSLPAGSTSSVLPAPWSSSVPGPHAIRIVLDVYDEVPESNETNNTATGTVSVVEVPSTTLSIGVPRVPGVNTTYVLPTTPLTLTAVEHTGLGPAGIWYRVDSGPWTPVPAGAPITLPPGAHTVYYNGTDLLGGSEPTRSANVFVDDEPPTTASAVASGASGGKVVTLAAADNASGVNWTEYRVDNGTWIRYSGTPLPLTDPGAHRVEFRSADRLGNLEAVKVVIVEIEAGGTTADVTPFNLKPFLALAFVIALVLAGWLAAPSDEPARRRRWFLTVVAPPVALEAFTGIASIGVPEMAVPSGFLGLPVDVALLVLGLLVIVFSRRRALRNL